MYVCTMCSFHPISSHFHAWPSLQVSTLQADLSFLSGQCSWNNEEEDDDNRDDDGGGVGDGGCGCGGCDVRLLVKDFYFSPALVVVTVERRFLIASRGVSVWNQLPQHQNETEFIAAVCLDCLIL